MPQPDLPSTSPPTSTQIAPQHAAGRLPEQLLVRELHVAERRRTFAVDDPYVEACWLPVIGPSATWCLRRLVTDVALHPDGLTLELRSLASELGLGQGIGQQSQVRHTLDRLASFGLVRFVDDTTLEVRRRIPPISERAVVRLGTRGAALHRALVQRASEESNAEDSPLLAAALDYAARGWPVLPLRAGDKVPNGVLVPRGLHDATCEAGQIREWWRRAPDGNVGIRTGGGLDVVDVDSDAARKALIATAPAPLAPSVLVRSSRGWHLWFASSELPTRARVIEGVDLRGAGGYIVAPPSIHPSGDRYTFVDPTSGTILDRLPSETQLSPAPGWLVNWSRRMPVGAVAEATPIRLGSDHYVHAAVAGECAAVAETPEGQRNDRLNRAAFALGTLVGAGALGEDVARAELLVAARAAGLGDSEATRTITSGLRAGTSQPRRIDELRHRPEPRSPSRRAAPSSATPRAVNPPTGEDAVVAVLARTQPTALPIRNAASRRPAPGPEGVER